MFNIPGHVIDTAKLGNMLHGPSVTDLEETFAQYVGAKYACSFNSATSAIFLIFKNKGLTVHVPSMIPPVVVNALLTTGNTVKFTDNVDWVGNSYVLYKFPTYKVVDSAQRLEQNQFHECNDNDLMIFSFYPTKPLGGCDGGMVVTNDYEKYKKMKELTMNGMKYTENSWDRNIVFPGYKMYMNSVQAEIILKNFDNFERKMEVLGNLVGTYNDSLGYDNFSRHLYRIEVDDNSAFIEYMKSHDIMCGIHYQGLHLHPVYKHLTVRRLRYDATERTMNRTVSLPMNEMLSDSDVAHIIQKVKEYGI
jgi:hypothetical protein